MPVPNSIADLSKIAADNSPAGTESAKGTIDDYFRAAFAFIKQLADLAGGPTVQLASSPAVSIGFAASANITITGGNSITAFDIWSEGALRWVTFSGTLKLTHNGASLQLPGAADIQTAAGDIALFKSLGGGNWKCLSYTRIGGEGVIQASTGRNGYLSAADWNTFNGKLSPAAAASLYLALTGGNLTGDIVFNNAAGILAKDATGVARRFFAVDPSNNVLIGNVGGQNIKFTNSAGGTIANLSEAGDFVARTGTFNSDERLKKRWRRAPGDLLRRVAGLRKLGTFLWRKDGIPGIGCSAQELEAIWPDAVHTDAKGVKSVNYGAAAFVIAVELARAFFRYVAKTDKRLAKLEEK